VKIVKIILAISAISAVLFVLTACSGGTNADNTTKPGGAPAPQTETPDNGKENSVADVVYIFPITAENNPDIWATYTTKEQMLNAVQIPDDVLNELTTKGLIKTCFQYPLFGDMLAFDSYQQGFDICCSGFNGLRELYGRDDTPIILLQTYENIDWKTQNENDEYSSLRFDYITMMLAQYSIIDRLTDGERDYLLDICAATNKQIDEEGLRDHYDTNMLSLIEFRIYMRTTPAFAELANKRASLKHFVETGRWPYWMMEDGELIDIFEDINKLFQ